MHCITWDMRYRIQDRDFQIDFSSMLTMTENDVKRWHKYWIHQCKCTSQLRCCFCTQNIHFLLFEHRIPNISSYFFSVFNKNVTGQWYWIPTKIFFLLNHFYKRRYKHVLDAWEEKKTKHKRQNMNNNKIFDSNFHQNQFIIEMELNETKRKHFLDFNNGNISNERIESAKDANIFLMEWDEDTERENGKVTNFKSIC